MYLARECADIADEISMRYFQRDPEVSVKQDGTLVTVADREAETAISKRIAEAFPGHAILGEEHGLQGDAGAPTWIIDPIDGTNNFAWGVPIFATLIALRIDGRTTIGVASAPALAERYEAARGDGARMNGEPIRVSSSDDLSQARICYSSHRSWEGRAEREAWFNLLVGARRDRGFGDFWGHMLVARGAADVMGEPSLAIWDVAAIEVIVEEAGGRLSGFTGNPYMQSPEGDGTALSTNGVLHDQVIARLAGGSG